MKRILWIVILVYFFVPAITIAQQKTKGEDNKKEAELICGKALDYLRGNNGVPIDTAKAIVLFKEAAGQGNLDAQYQLGYFYGVGKGLQRDFQKSVYWYRKAAEQGYTESQVNLGCMFIRGEGVPEDYKQAVFWFKKAVDGGNDAGLYNLGLCYLFGYGVKKDLDMAKRLFIESARLGYQDAKERLKESFGIESY